MLADEVRLQAPKSLAAGSLFALPRAIYASGTRKDACHLACCGIVCRRVDIAPFADLTTGVEVRWKPPVVTTHARDPCILWNASTVALTLLRSRPSIRRVEVRQLAVG